MTESLSRTEELLQNHGITLLGSDAQEETLGREAALPRTDLCSRFKLTNMDCNHYILDRGFFILGNVTNYTQLLVRIVTEFETRTSSNVHVPRLQVRQ